MSKWKRRERKTDALGGKEQGKKGGREMEKKQHLSRRQEIESNFNFFV